MESWPDPKLNPHDLFGEAVNFSDIVRAMESLERYEDGVTTALRLLELWPCNPVTLVEANRALGRCHAKLGRADKAEAAFRAGIIECARVKHAYHELLVQCDFVEYVL